MRPLKAFYFIFLVVVLAGCRREFESPSWEVNVNAPLLYSDMGIEDLIPDSLLEVNPDNSVNLVFQQEFFNYGLDSILGLTDSTIKDSFISFISSTVPPNSTLFTNTDNNELNLNGPELTRLILKEGYLDYTIANTIADTILVTYTITTGTQYGLPISLTVTLPPGSLASPSVVSGTFNLAESDLDLTGIAHNTFNSYQTKFTAKTAPGVSSVSLNSSSRVRLNAAFRGLVPGYVKGYFGNLSDSPGLSTQTFDFFENLGNVTLDLSSVTANLYIENGLGADARLRIDTLMAARTDGTGSVLFNHSIVGQTININRATDLGYAALPYMFNTTVNSSNSNIESMLELIPDQLKYKVFVELNPLGNVSNHTDFIYENSRVAAGISMTIPLNLIASNISFSDTLDFNLDQYDQNGRILKGRVRFNVENGLPIGAQLNVVLLDDNNMSIGHLLYNVNIAGNSASTTMSSGTPAAQTVYADIDEQNIEAAYRAKKIVIYPVFNTVPSGTFVSIYNTQRFKTQISILVDYLTQQ